MRQLTSESSSHAPWPAFGKGLLPPGVLLEHKPAQGNVDLTLSKRSPKDVPSGVVLPAGAQVARIGGSTAIRVDVPRIDHLMDFEGQIEAVRAALRAVRVLRDAWPALRAELGF
jgi:hypothetical protein